VAGCGECGDEPSGSCATELDRWLIVRDLATRKLLNFILFSRHAEISEKYTSIIDVLQDFSVCLLCADKKFYS
jgi:hypothetical protein